MRDQDTRVPPEVEQFLIELFGRAGQMGGTVGGGIGAGGAGAAGGGRGGARGGARGATRLKTVVEDRTGVTSVPGQALTGHVTSVFPRAMQLPSEDHVLRLAIPVGRTGLQQVVVDISLDDAPSTTSDRVLVRAYAKEGLLSRKLAARIADQVAQLLVT